MSVLGEHTEVINNKKDLQIWNNAAFDNGGDSESLNSGNQIKSPSWLSKKSVSKNPSCDSFDSSLSSKENQSPIRSSNSSVLVHPLHQSKPLKNVPIKNCSLRGGVLDKTGEEIEIENEISRLLAKLESIRLKKAEQKGINHEKPVVASNFIEPLKKKDPAVKNNVELGFSKPKIQRRGFSLGPNEIMSATNPKSKQLSTTPIQSTQNRRKSCFWKLEDIEEEKLGFSKSKNSSSLRQAVTSIGSKKGTKKDDLILASVQPKKLFGDHSVPAKKPLKPGRVIPSRYNQATINSSMKKKSLTENVDRRSHGGTEGRVKKKWEIPTDFVIPKRLDLDENENETENDDFVIPMLLPKIKAVRNVDDWGRDSGPAKRVAELAGKKSYFHVEVEKEEETVCQKLSFEED